jgi:hypothetical protein
VLAIKMNLMTDAGFDEEFAAQLAAEAIDGLDMAKSSEEQLVAEATEKILGRPELSGRLDQFQQLTKALMAEGYDTTQARRLAKQQLKKDAGTGGSLKREFETEIAEDDRVKQAFSEHSRRKSQMAAVSGVLGDYFDEREAYDLSKRAVRTLAQAPMAPSRDAMIDKAAEKALSSHKRKVSVLHGIKMNLMMDAGLDEDEAAKLARKTMIDLDSKKKDEAELIAEATSRALGKHRRRVSQFAGLQSALIDSGFEEDQAKIIARQQMKKQVGGGDDDYDAEEKTADRGTGRRGSVEVVDDESSELVTTVKLLQKEVDRLRELVLEQRDELETMMAIKQEMARSMNESMDEMRKMLLAYTKSASDSS